MASLGTLVPTGDVSIGTWLDNAGGGTNLWSKIEETIASAVDTNDFIKSAANPTGSPPIVFDVTNTPADFTAITALSIQVRVARLNAAGNDTMGLQALVESSAGVAWTNTLSFTVAVGVAYANSSVTAFTVNATGLAASKAGWDGARLRLVATQTSSGGADGNSVVVSAVQLTGTYTATVDAVLAAPLGSLVATMAAAPQRDATLSAPLGALTASATATPDHPATLAGPLGSLDASISATVEHPASLSASLGALVASVDVTVEHPATFTSSLGALTASTPADIEHAAVLDSALGSLSASLEATVTGGEEIEAALSAALGALVASADAVVEHVVVATAVLGALTATATAARVVDATLAAPLGALLAAIVFTYPASSSPTVTGGTSAPTSTGGDSTPTTSISTTSSGSVLTVAVSSPSIGR